jgi:hypothetical protein
MSRWVQWSVCVPFTRGPPLALVGEEVRCRSVSSAAKRHFEDTLKGSPLYDRHLGASSQAAS